MGERKTLLHNKHISLGPLGFRENRFEKGFFPLYVFKTFVLSIFEWLLKTDFTIHPYFVFASSKDSADYLSVISSKIS